MPRHYRNQKYSSIKNSCLKRGVLFEDPEFPANNKSLYYSKVETNVDWVRPKELCKVPRLLVEGVTCEDLETGEPNNAWFITACTALAHSPRVLHKVIPDSKSQEYDEKNPYAGIFHFIFWRFGEWLDVVVDDRLPCRDGKQMFLHSRLKNEFWPALLEKAYAKLYGDYESLLTGQAADALVDFTGGVSEKLTMKSYTVDRSPLFRKLDAASDNSALINCHIQCESRLMGTGGPKGLVLGRGYNVNEVKTIEVKKSLQASVGAASLQMVKLFNPWLPTEWTGAYSEESKEWKALAKTEWAKMGIKFDCEGEFWMSFEDFATYFTNVDICHSVNTSVFTLKKTWVESIMYGAWTTAGRNGGYVFGSRTFLSNPQFVFDITTEEPDTIMTSIEQRDVQEDRVPLRDNMNTIGFYVIKVDVNRTCRVHQLGEKVCVSEFLKSRNVFGSCRLPPGRYVIIPCCASAGTVGDFMLRLYTTNKTSTKELVNEAPPVRCCAGRYRLVTTLTVDSVQGLKLPDNTKGVLNPYVIINCEGQKVQSHHQKNTTDPEFNLTATFYRKKPATPIIVKVMNHNKLLDNFMGQATITWDDADKSGTEKGEKKEFDLFGLKKESKVKKPGQLFVFIQSSQELTDL